MDVCTSEGFISSILVHPLECSPEWTKAAQQEYDALKHNQTWELVSLPPNRRAVGCKWVFRIKKHADGSVARYKGRLVVKGYLQEARIDFYETFSPVVKPTTIRVVLSLAVQFGWSLRQVDINNAFLNGDLNEEIYMLQPPGFEQHNNGQPLVCKLKKALYGLKQAPRAWFQKLKDYLVASGFILSKVDAFLFIKQNGDILLYVLVYVDDIIITGNHQSTIDAFVESLESRFSLKDLGKLSYFLGIEVTHTASGLFLNQQKYIRDLLQHSRMEQSKGTPTPMVSSCLLFAHTGSPIANESEYRSIVGALQYIVITRPDIAFAVNKVCQFMHTPLDSHFKAIKRILRYLQATIDHGVHFTAASHLSIVGYSDASWGNDPDDRQSTSGFCIFLGGNPVSWGSKKQHVVSRSSAEAEYRSLAHAAAEVTWLESLLGELQVQLAGKTTLWCDNSSTVAVSANPILHSKFKHVELDLFFVREKVTTGRLVVGHVLAQDQVADVLTKPFSAGCFTKFKT
ncbi:Retrovirus-related Pol polyprotein from transposon TNT 1-94 [Gossypium australe]|uniref:Retrovirus-related Pol polyprotein from transposon TNT 1-94 n=1 Tax=Gossypium australe TaxID=47621 RepID=A0A5B6V7G5_9ROSI|nr:Retrovirus-related Pol polyprotein from transposon TNT 1-94 [Gossypium australe]